MNKDFYQKEHALKIYALISEDLYVYIGKTKAQKLSAVFSRHICGSCAATRDHFGKKDPIRPKMYLLEQIQATEAVGYRHVLAFAAVFLQTGYIILNHQGTREQLFDLHPETRKLVEKIRSTPLETILMQTYLPKPTAADGDHIPVPQELSIDDAPLSERICVRLTEGEKDAFDDYASSLHMTQRDALVYLLHKATSAKPGSEDQQMDQFMSRSMKLCQERVKHLEKENKKLLQKKTSKDNNFSLCTQTQRFAFIQKGIGEYFQYFAPSSGDSDSLSTGNYRRFVRSLPRGVQYEYPSADGFMMFYPQHILWGQSRPPVCFILGLSETGQRIKLRYYDKYYYVGPRLINKRFAFHDMCWLVGFQRAPDGAMDVVLSLPLSVHPTTGDTQPEPKQPKRSLDSIISEIEKKF